MTHAWDYDCALIIASKPVSSMCPAFDPSDYTKEKMKALTDEVKNCIRGLLPKLDQDKVVHSFDAQASNREEVDEHTGAVWLYVTFRIDDSYTEEQAYELLKPIISYISQKFSSNPGPTSPLQPS